MVVTPVEHIAVEANSFIASRQRYSFTCGGVVSDDCGSRQQNNHTEITPFNPKIASDNLGVMSSTYKIASYLSAPWRFFYALRLSLHL
jgi:hypothetical protein